MFLIDKIKDIKSKVDEAFEMGRDSGGFGTAIYYVYKIGTPILLILIVLLIAAVIYCKVKGIDIVLPF